MDAPVREGDVLARKYRVERVIGQGGMGVVVAAVHEQLGTRVALKFLLPPASENTEAVARFLREAQAAVRIQSEHVARTLDVGTLESGAPYLVMEFLNGSDLSRVLDTRGPLPIDEAIGYVLQACEAVAEAHAAGIVHRDLKPANLFLTQRADGSPLVKVLDFGISKAMESASAATQGLTGTGALMGSPAYMSPEQVRSSKHVDARSDVWALGVILHQLISGRLPFEGSTTTEILAMIVADPPTRLRQVMPSVSDRLEAVIVSCLEKNLARRTPSVADLARALVPFAPRSAMVSVERIVGLQARTRGASSPGLGAGGETLAVPEGSFQAFDGAGGTGRSSNARRGPGGPEGTGRAWGTTASPHAGSGRRTLAIAGVAVVVLGAGAIGVLALRSGPAVAPPIAEAAHAADTVSRSAAVAAPPPPVSATLPVATAPPPVPAAPSAAPVPASEPTAASASTPDSRHAPSPHAATPARHAPANSPSPSPSPSPSRPAPAPGPTDDLFNDMR